MGLSVLDLSFLSGLVVENSPLKPISLVVNTIRVHGLGMMNTERALWGLGTDTLGMGLGFAQGETGSISFAFGIG